jgi:BioD-like phosphotransacetylase family protein
VLASFQRVAEGKRLVLIEGTGHAGVGSVLDMSNARVAELLESKAVIVTTGGVGRPIDEILLNAALFKLHGVELAGVILNRVLPDKLDMVEYYARKSLQSHGIQLFGVIPYQPQLEGPSIRQILEDVKGELLNGDERLDTTVTRTIVGAMSPHRALEYMNRDVLLITPGDREDLILAALSSYVSGVEDGMHVSGIVLTGGVEPHRNIMRLVRRTPVPVILVEEMTYDTASRIRDLVVKIRPTDKMKIALARRLVNNYVEIDKLLAGL